LKKDISIASLRCGLLVFFILTLTLLCKGGSFILLSIYVAPGLFYGLVLLSSVDPPNSAVGTILFMVLCVAINIFCVYQVTKDALNIDPSPYTASKVITYSTLGAVMLSIFYDLLVAHRFSVFYTIAMPTILGIVASLVSAGCMYILFAGKYNEFVSGLLWIGMFTIFPIWQYLLGLNIKNHNKAGVLSQ
jgi:hypothetical protein